MPRPLISKANFRKLSKSGKKKISALASGRSRTKLSATDYGKLSPTAKKQVANKVRTKKRKR